MSILYSSESLPVGGGWRGRIRDFWQRISPIGLAHRSVRGKVMGLVLLSTAIALLVAGSAMLTHDLGIYRHYWASDLATEAGIIASSCTPALAFDDHDAAERALSRLQARSEVLVAALYAADGHLFADYNRTKSQSAPLHVPAFMGLVVSGDRVDITVPLAQNHEVLGTLYLRASYDLAGRIEAYLGIFAGVIVLSMCVAIALTSTLQRIITVPIDSMAHVARLIVEKGDYTLRARKSSKDEIGLLTEAFNQMLDEVQQTNSVMKEEVATRQAAEWALREAHMRKDEFIATLAHELRNPLAPIQQAVRILQLPASDMQQRQWAGRVIARQTQRMALLLDDLLDVSRITSGRLNLKKELVALETLVATAIETARPLIERKHHTLSVHLPAAVLDLDVDPLRLSQALSNLLANAAKYTDPGGAITVTVSLSPVELCMSVKDTGIGLSAHAITRVFEMFSQVESAIDRSEGGLGIGLALVKGVIVLHGGSVEAASEGIGRGSTFTIRLPIAVVKSSGSRPNPPTPHSNSSQKARSKVLVADDNVDAAQTLALVLVLAGYDVHVAHSGEEALRLGAELHPEAFILDIGMPSMTGYETARRLRQENWSRSSVLIAVTGWGQEQDKEKAMASGFDVHLTKPVDSARLEELLAKYLAARATDTAALST
jgi:signal transduction histidine kinase/ActR/RegA family two-component response regulator